MTNSSLKFCWLYYILARSVLETYFPSDVVCSVNFMFQLSIKRDKLTLSYIYLSTKFL